MKDAPQPFSRRTLWGFAAIIGLTLIAYFPCLRSPLIWNDEDYVTHADLQPISGLGRIWFEVGATQQYYPVLHSAFWLEHRLWGDAPLGYHLTNVLLHAAAACLFVLVLKRLFGTHHETLARSATSGGAERASASESACWLAGLLFALHPICVESAAWISEEKNTLSTAFYLLAALVYLRFDNRSGVAVDLRATANGAASRPAVTRRSAATYVLATLFFALALLSKSVTATLPAAILVALWWRRGRLGWRRDVLPLIPWFGLGAAVGLFTAWVEKRYIGAQGPSFALGWAQRLQVAGHIPWFYLAKLVWPFDLIFIYPRWELNPASWRAWLSLLALAGGLLALGRFRGGGRARFSTALFFLGTLFPVLGFLNVYAFIFSFVADHFQYLACLGPIALAAAGWAAWRRTASSPAPLALAAAVIAGLGFLTWRQCGNYHDLETFYRRILEKNPASWMAEDNLGTELDRQGRRDEAIRHFQAALRIWPDDPNPHNNLGVDLEAGGRRSEAIAEFETALRLRPGYVEARVNLAGVWREQGRTADAIALCRQALQLRPNFPDALDGLGLALAAAGRPGEAIDEYQAALRTLPRSAGIHNNLGLALMACGRRDEAITEFEQTLRLNPRQAETEVNLGAALAGKGRLAAAISHYESALQLKPGYALAHNDLGLALAQSGKMEEAIEEFRAAIRLDPGYADPRRNLGIALRVRRP